MIQEVKSVLLAKQTVPPWTAPTLKNVKEMIRVELSTRSFPIQANLLPPRSKITALADTYRPAAGAKNV